MIADRAVDIHQLTPVEDRGELSFKRDDLFIPPGMAGLNGGKLRMYMALAAGFTPRTRGMLTGSPLNAPTVPCVSAAARAYGLKSVHVIGATTPHTAMLRQNIQLAVHFGARFIINPVAYGPALRRRVSDVLAGDKRLKGYVPITSPIGDGLPREDVLRAHACNAAQVNNLPEDVNTLVVPAGSGGTAASVLLGVALHRPPGLRHVELVGIGPSKAKWIQKRFLDLLEWADALFPADDVTVTYHDAYKTEGMRYAERVNFQYDDIVFHPIYEAKMMRWLHSHLPRFLSRGRVCVWIVGAEPPAADVRAALTNIPEEAPLL